MKELIEKLIGDKITRSVSGRDLNLEVYNSNGKVIFIYGGFEKRFKKSVTKMELVLKMRDLLKNIKGSEYVKVTDRNTGEELLTVDNSELKEEFPSYSDFEGKVVKIFLEKS